MKGLASNGDEAASERCRRQITATKRCLRAGDIKCLFEEAIGIFLLDDRTNFILSEVGTATEHVSMGGLRRVAFAAELKKLPE